MNFWRKKVDNGPAGQRARMWVHGVGTLRWLTGVLLLCGSSGLAHPLPATGVEPVLAQAAATAAVGALKRRTSNWKERSQEESWIERERWSPKPLCSLQVKPDRQAK